MIEEMDKMNELLEENNVMVRIGTSWYCLDVVGPIENDSIPIIVADEDGGDHEFDLADIDEFDLIPELINKMDSDIVGIA